MNEPTPDDGMTEMVRRFMDDVRTQANDREEEDVVDRILAAAAFVFAALIIVWPKGKKVPTFAAIALNVGRQIWKRKAWLGF